MANRSSQHESTGYTLNMLMLRKEVATLMYEVPNRVKPTNVHDRVWKLRQTLQQAHKYAVQFTKQSLLSQKRYLDQNVVKTFEKGDKVLVYFPQRWIRKSAKLTSYWYVPYKIIQQHTGVTFKIRKEEETKTLTVHVDRLRPQGTKVLGDKNGASKEQDLAVDVDKCNHINDSSDSQMLCGCVRYIKLNEIELDNSGRRQRKRPAKHSEY